jgi:uncharacterized protein YbjT (DUF2867 family)
MSTHILVTGAGGRAGIEMVRRLKAAGAEVRAATHYPDREDEARAEAVDYVQVDLLRPETLTTAFRGVERAVFITPEHPQMVEMTANLVAAAENAGLQHIVRISFMNAGTGVGGPLLEWHRQAEEVVAASSIPSTHLRPNSYMQNFLTMYAPSIFVRGAFYTPMGRGRISYIDARDVADAAVAILLGHAPGGGTYSLTGLEPLAHDEIARVLSEETGQAIKYVDVGEDDACLALHRRGAAPELVEALCELWLAMRADDFAPTATGLQDLTGRVPLSFVDFVREHRTEIRVSGAARD